MNLRKHAVMKLENHVAAPDGPAQAIQPAPDPLAEESTVLLQDQLAEAWPAVPAPSGLRDRLARRASHSADRIRSMVNVRQRERVLIAQSPGVRVHRVYQREEGVALRLGEPLQVCVARLEPGASWQVGPAGAEVGPASAEVGPTSAEVGRDWLLIDGAAQLKAEGEEAVALGPLDYHVQSAGPSHKSVSLHAGEAGATVMLRERVLPAQASGPTCTARESPEAWEDYAPQIKRRVLWRHGPMAAMLWLAAPGATVPHHEHGHDEECLMLRGDLFQDDYLLCEGDYQLAPGGTSHETVNTDTGALIYAHGDLDMRLV